MKLKKAINIKRLLIGGIFLILNAYTGLHAISDEELYLQGNNYYLQGDYNKALVCYREVKRKGPAVFHNMGNCYSYLSNHLDAVVSWRLAQRTAGYREFDELERAIKQEKQNYYKQENSEPENSKIEKHDFGVYTERLFGPYSFLWLQIMFLFLWYLFFLLFYRKKIRQQKSLFSRGVGRFFNGNAIRLITGVSSQSAWRVTSWFTSLLYLCILGCMIFLGIGMWLKNKEHNYQRAIVIQSSATLHAGPQKKFQKIAELGLLDELLVEKSSKGWSKVIIDKNSNAETGWPKIGWIQETSIRIID